MPGPAGPGAPSIDPCHSVLGTCPLAAWLAPRVGHWPGSHGPEVLHGLSTLDHTWPCSAPVGFNQSWITMPNQAGTSWREDEMGECLMATSQQVDWAKPHYVVGRHQDGLQFQKESTENNEHTGVRILREWVPGETGGTEVLGGMRFGKNGICLQTEV